MQRLETKRLILREWKEADIPIFIAMNQDPKVMAFFPACAAPKQSETLVKRIKQHFTDHGFGLFAVELKATGEFIGFVGLSIPGFEAAFMPCVEIGWRLAAKFWGQGYATEAAQRVLHEAFERYHLKEVVSFTSTLNLPSIRIMEKLGMQHNPADDFYHPQLPKTHPLAKHVLYRLNLEQFRKNSHTFRLTTKGLK